MINYTPVKILFELGSLKVYSWGLFFAIAFLTAFFLILREARKKKIDTSHIYNVGFLTLLGAVLGSRLFYVIENLGYFLGKPLEIFSFWDGGLTSYGGIFLGLLFVWIYVKKNSDLKFLQLLDISAPYIILALAIGRIGCFLNWCCYGIGSELPWAIKIPDDIPRHPTQFYDIFANLIIFFVLIKLKNKKQEGEKFSRFRKDSYKDISFIHESNFFDKEGSMFLIFTTLYSLSRFFIDFLRDHHSYLLGLATSQWVCILIFIASVIAIANIDKIQRKDFGWN